MECTILKSGHIEVTGQDTVVKMVPPDKHANVYGTLLLFIMYYIYSVYINAYYVY